MRKEYIAIIALLIVIIVGTLLYNSSSSSSNNVKSQGSTLSDLQITACNSADAGNTCDTKLGEVGIVTKEQCCSSLGKCC